VTAHRGAFLQEGRVVTAENSIPAIARARDMGCDMVEIDVRFTADGTAVVIHDADLDRTVAGSGPIAGQRWADIKDLPLVHPKTRAPLGVRLPVLEEAFAALDGRMMINVELKTGIDAIPEVARIARAAGVSDLVTMKTNMRAPGAYDRLLDKIGEAPGPVDFIPVVIDSLDGLEGFEAVCDLLVPHCVECVVDYPFGDPGINNLSRRGFTLDGGPLFSIPARRRAAEGNIRLFINTLYVSPVHGNYQWNGGRSCDLALVAPDSVYSFWIAHGATMLQTDMPDYLLGWLREAGFRP